MAVNIIFLVFGVGAAVATLLAFKDSVGKWAAIAFFVGIASIGLVFIIWGGDPPTAKDTAREQAGGDNFCFLEPYIPDPKVLTDPIFLKVINNGSAPIQNLQFLISPYWIHGDEKNHHNEYVSIMPSSSAIDCNVGSNFALMPYSDGRNRSLNLAPGRYRIAFTSPNATWIEILTIEQVFDNLVGLVDIFQPGKPPYHSPRPPGYAEWGQPP